MNHSSGRDRVSWWEHSVDDVVRDLATDKNDGLTDQEAKKRLEKWGENRLPEETQASSFILLLNQFSSPIVWVLLGTLVISGFIGEWADAIAIGIIVALNSIIGFYQEYKAERSLQALKKMMQPVSRVIRDGRVKEIPSYAIVPGDLIMLEAGDFVPADGRIIQTVQMAIQESSLTGESIPVEKQTDALDKKDLRIEDRSNFAFMGTMVVRGKGVMVATATAKNTALGAIATFLTEKEDQTPLQKQLARLGFHLVAICFVIVAGIFLVGMLHGHKPLTMFLTALSLAIAAIPEGLPAVVTVALSIGVHRMAKKNAIVKKLLSVETLGSTSIICTDKTGTLTKNEMTIQKIWVGNRLFDVTGVGYDPKGDFLRENKVVDAQNESDLYRALTIGVLCNGAYLSQQNGMWRIVGDPTEGAFLVVAEKAGLTKSSLEKLYPLVSEVPFDSERKRMSMLREAAEGKMLFVKGASDVLLGLSKKILVEGRVVPLTHEHRVLIEEKTSQFAAQALRVLAVAFRDVSFDGEKVERLDPSLEEDLVFVALVAMIDPPRREAKKAIETCTEAGIRTIMITGDHKDTARAIGGLLQLSDGNNDTITGVELDAMSDRELEHSLERISIYARTSAENKLRIVKAWKQRGAVVAVTGDGVNDAPAIKAADIGVAMGITGTEVTKEAADMVIVDDNFASIVSAVEEGRGIYDNIIKFIKYLLSANFAELFVIFLGSIMTLKDPLGNPHIPLLPVQLLWLNLVTDGLPAIALAMDPINPQAMSKRPRNPRKKILSFYFVIDIVLLGLVLAAGVFFACLLGLRTSADYAYTMTLTSFVFLELIRLHMIRTRYQISFFSNRWLLLSLLISLGAQLCIVYIPPLQKIFHLVPLYPVDWVILIAITLAAWGVGMVLEKFVVRVYGADD